MIRSRSARPWRASLGVSGFYEKLQTPFRFCFNGNSHQHPGPRRCSHRLEQLRTQRDPRWQHGATDCFPQSCHSSRLNLRCGQRPSPARTNLTWCKAQCRPALRVRQLPAPRRTKRSSICFRLPHPASMRFMPRFSLESPMGPKRSQVSCEVNSSRIKSLPRVPTMVGTPPCCRRAAAVLVCGCRLLRRFFPMRCRNGDLSPRLQ